MSKVYYKFKSQKKNDTIIFDGLSISVFDVKREILLQQKLDGVDFDLELKDAASENLFKDDNQMIPRNSSLIVRRIPAKEPHSATRYLAALKEQASVAPSQQYMPSLAQQQSSSIPSYGTGLPGLSSGLPGLSGSMPQQSLSSMQSRQIIDGDTEEDRIKQLFTQSNEIFENQSNAIGQSQMNKMSSIIPPGQQQRMQIRPGYANVDPSKPPPISYTCHRCGIKGHYIQFCPTWGNPAFDNIRIKKTTGIPRSFLKTIGNVGQDDMQTGDQLQQIDPSKLDELGAKSVMVTPEGDVVVAQINDSLYRRQMRRVNEAQSNDDILRQKAKELEEGEENEEPGKFMRKDLLCLICNQIMKMAVNLECCKCKFCESCIIEHLKNQSKSNRGIMNCPQCSQQVNMDSVIIDKPSRAKVDSHLRFIAQYIKHQPSAVGQSTVTFSDGQDNSNAFYNGVNLPFKGGSDGLPWHISYNQAEIARLRFDPSFEMHPSGRIAVMDFTEDRSQIYDSKYHERVTFECVRNNVFHSVQNSVDIQSRIPKPPPHRVEEWQFYPPPWTLNHRDREHEDPAQFIIKIAGQDEAFQSTRKRSASPDQRYDKRNRSRSPSVSSSKKNYQSRRHQNEHERQYDRYHDRQSHDRYSTYEQTAANQSRYHNPNYNHYSRDQQYYSDRNRYDHQRY